MNSQTGQPRPARKQDRASRPDRHDDRFDQRARPGATTTSPKPCTWCWNPIPACVPHQIMFKSQNHRGMLDGWLSSEAERRQVNVMFTAYDTTMSPPLWGQV
jgi:hypothetical protein